MNELLIKFKTKEQLHLFLNWLDDEKEDLIDTSRYLGEEKARIKDLEFDYERNIININ